MADATLKNFLEKAARLYEQEQRDPEGPAVLGRYVRRWLGWASGGLGESAGPPGELGRPAAHSVVHMF